MPGRITSLTEDGGASSTLAPDFAPPAGLAAGFRGIRSPQAAYTTPRHAVIRHLGARRVYSFSLCTVRYGDGKMVAASVDPPLFPTNVFVHGCRDLIKVLQSPGVLSIVSSGRGPNAF